MSKKMSKKEISERDSRISHADTLYVMGAIDKRALLEAHEFPNLEEVLKRMGE